MKLLPLILTGAMLLPIVSAAPTAQRNSDRALPATSARFTYVDVYADPHDKPLAAYQFEFTATAGNVQVVGIEGGAHPAFANAPYYDPAALHGQHRVIVAAFNTGKDLPNGKTRIARIHLRVDSAAPPAYQATLETAADDRGTKIDATITVEQGVSR